MDHQDIEDHIRKYSSEARADYESKTKDYWQSAPQAYSAVLASFQVSS